MFESQRFARRIIISRNSIPFRASFSCGRREARSHGRDSPASRPCCEGRRFPFRRTPDRVLPGIPGERTTAVPARFRCRVIRSHRPSTGLPNPNNSVVATADNADSSLRSGRPFSAVPHFKRSPQKFPRARPIGSAIRFSSCLVSSWCFRRIIRQLAAGFINTCGAKAGRS